VNDRSLTALGALTAIAMAAAPDELSYPALKTRLRDVVRRDPMDATLTIVVVGAVLFYKAEKGQNPRVETLGDAFVFISTCLSVGYADTFARTPAGKAIATFVMTFGPAISGSILEPPASQAAPQKDDGAAALLASQGVIIEKLSAILDELARR
jgi:hypothetical protein